jgi:uncharacterized oligopeptide transporter (OPT) family protein
MYLPFDTSSAIFVGGLIKWVVDRMTAPRTAPEKLRIEERGTLVASGLIAGGAIMEIVAAVIFLAGVHIGTPSFYESWGGWLSLIGFASIAYALIRIPVAAK